MPKWQNKIMRRKHTIEPLAFPLGFSIQANNNLLQSAKDVHVIGLKKRLLKPKLKSAKGRKIIIDHSKP